MLKLRLGLCAKCDDGIKKEVVGQRENTLCKSHYIAKKQSQRKPINKKSETRKEEDKIYFAVRAVFLADNKNCACQLPGCTGKAKYVHHTKGRDKYYLVIETWLPVCQNCHDIVEPSVEMAKRKNFSQDRLSKQIIELPFNLKLENSINKLRTLAA